ncbi:MAG: multiheme c-type cytochrome [bacterium]
MKKTWTLTFLFVFVFAAGATGQEKAEEEKQHAFIGVAKCKTCHRTAKQGEQFVLWEKSKHAKAYETLAGHEAKKTAKEKGIENPQTAKECLKCHVTAYGVDEKLLGEKYTITAGVGCESCHGAGADYYKRKTMKAITAGTLDGATVGLIMPDEKVCVGCHNEESPYYKKFDFAAMSKKIAHPVPKAAESK